MKVSLLSLFLLFLLFGCSERKGKIDMSKYGAMEVRCVGRNYISVPRNFDAATVTTGIFRPVGRQVEDPAFDAVVRAGDFTRQQFAAEVQKRRSELTRGGNERVNVLRLDKEFPDGSILLRIQEIEDAYLSELNFLRDGSVVTIRLNSYHEQYLQAEEELIKFAAGVKAVDLKENRTGFCLGKVEVKGNFEAESGSFWFRDGKGADFEVDVDTYKPDAEVPLLERMQGPDSLLKVFNLKHKVLRARERSVAGMRTQEWLAWAKLTDESDAKTLKFALETIRSKPNRVAPSITVTFNTAQSLDDGSPTKTLVSDDEAMQLWDAVVDSIKPATI
jgi:hypothetical protein